MREIRTSGSEGGGTQANASSLPLAGKTNFQSSLLRVRFPLSFRPGARQAQRPLS